MSEYKVRVIVNDRAEEHLIEAESFGISDDNKLIFRDNYNDVVAYFSNCLVICIIKQ